MYTTEIVKNKFWILEDAGVKLGTIRRTNSEYFEVIIKDALELETLSLDALTSKYGTKILESKQVKKIEAVDYGKGIDEVFGFPSKHNAYMKENILVQDKQIPTYTKSEKSNVRYAAGYYGLHFTGVWRNAYCVKLDTLTTYEYVGPFKTKSELEAEVLRKSKE
jgi:hypothetical protein